ncbi:hypothetical protein DXG01_007254 [Tephrocybe rancida]|nr:hypothetical protein DXG01_007254 [Tephrocybe rancida]
MSSLKFSPEQIVALTKKLSSKVSNDLSQYAIDYPKDSPMNKDRSILKERVADLPSVAVKVVSVTGFEDAILNHKPFCEQMFQLSKYRNDLLADCEQAHQDFLFGDSHMHIYCYLKEFKENRKAEAEKAAKVAAEKAIVEEDIPAKRTRSKCIPKKSAVYHLYQLPTSYYMVQIISEYVQRDTRQCPGLEGYIMNLILLMGTWPCVPPLVLPGMSFSAEPEFLEAEHTVAKVYFQVFHNMFNCPPSTPHSVQSRSMLTFGPQLPPAFVLKKSIV